MIGKLIKMWQSLRYYVIADPFDNSITLSKRLFEHIRKNAKDKSAASVFVFYIPGTKTYGFIQNHSFDHPVQLCEIQYNDKHKCIGFETLCPSVGAILYNYSLPSDKSVRLSVTVKKNYGKVYYHIEKPLKGHLERLVR